MSLRIISSHGIRHDLVTIRSWRASLFLIFYFFLSRESRFCFRERHGCAFARVMAVPLGKGKTKCVFCFFHESHDFASARGTVVLTRKSRPCLSEREKIRVFCFFFFRESVTPSIQSYTNHTRKCVRSRSRTHGKISQHNSRHKLK